MLELHTIIEISVRSVALSAVLWLCRLFGAITIEANECESVMLEEGEEIQSLRGLLLQHCECAVQRVSVADVFGFLMTVQKPALSIHSCALCMRTAVV